MEKRAIRRVIVAVGMAACLLLPIVVLGQEEPPETITTTISGKVNLEITGMSYDTLTLVNCFNVDLVGCSIKNLVLVRCWNIDATDCDFVGEGVAVTIDTSMAVAVTGCRFDGAYSQKLMSMRSVLVTIE
jgi:hypothetical protein